MRRQAFALVLFLLLLIPVVRAETPAAVDPDLKKGIQQVDEGDYDAAIFTLDSASRRLSAAHADPSDVGQAYLYLGIAYIGKGREAAAKAQFREAIGQIKDLTLSADRFPPKVIDVFSAAKEEASRDASAQATATPAATTPAPVTESTPSEPEKKGGGHKGLLIGGLVVVGGGAAALAAGGGGGSSSSTPSSAGSSNSGNTNLQTLTFQGSTHGTENFTVVATRPGTLTARAAWGAEQGQFELQITCQLKDPPYTDCGGAYNRTSNTSSAYVANVVQQSYLVGVVHYDGNRIDYTLTVTFP